MSFIEQIRKYRFQINSDDDGFLFNDKNIGIALFDLLSSYLGFFILDKLFNFTSKIDIRIYYALVIPTGIITHILFEQNTFLNNKLLNDKNDILYKIFTVVLIALPFLMFKK